MNDSRLTGALALAFVIFVAVRPGRNNTKLINDMSVGYGNMIKVAMGDMPGRCTSEYPACPENDRRCIQKAEHTKSVLKLHVNRAGFAWDESDLEWLAREQRRSTDG
jgi:hypothetical protein